MKTLQEYTKIARKFAPKGQIGKSAKAWHEKGKARQEVRQEGRDPLPKGFGQGKRRALRQIVEKYTPEIRRRGFDTTIEEKHGTANLSVRDYENGLWLLGASGWRHYSNRFGQRYAQIAYLCGLDDNGPWVVRVPGNTGTVADALRYTVPAEVRKAQAAGKIVLRQGDVFVIEMKRDGKRDLPAGHEFDEESRVLSHEGGHQDLHVSFPCKFVQGQGLTPRSAWNGRGWWD